ncbi:MAG TPA: capsule assembly Wzi family protein [Longimicrobium sp.]|nr:capsule assembly Wzi family protein [Longimicrobium sp.]
MGCLAAPAAAQDPPPAFDAPDTAARAAPRPWRVIGGIEEERERAGQLRGAPADGGFLLRSLSSRTPRRDGGAYLAVLAPRVEAVWNSRIPFSANDGPLWAGRGVSVRTLAGVEAVAGPLRLIVAPELVHQENRSFDALLPQGWDSAQVGRFTAPWSTGTHSVDLPYRFGDGPMTTVFAGESSLALRLGAVEAGAATESQWWGPGARNAIVLSNHAGGFPHLFLRTARGIRTPLGTVEARWIAGRLSSSPFDTASVGRHRSLSAAAVVVSPGAGLSLGAARAVYAPAGGGADALGDAGAVFSRWRGAGDTTASRPYDQLSSLFARWVAPGEGAEVYAEWARRRLPGSLRDALEQPEHTQGFTLGAGWAGTGLGGVMRLQGEATYLEKSATYRARPTASWYAGRAVPQGYTHRGQVLGAAVGPGGSGQWVAVDWLRPRAQAGLFATRVRWANDAYYDKPGGHNRYRAHDVSILWGARGGFAVGGAWVDAEWTAGRRYNFLFQNPATGWEDRHLSVSPYNHTLRLRLSTAPPPLPR